MILTFKNFNVENRKVLVREDFNVPIKSGKILDNSKIENSLETIEYLVKKKAKIILLSHLGRPEGKVKKSLSLKIVKEELSKLLGKEVFFSRDLDLRRIKKRINSLQSGQILLLENLRFKPQEESNSLDFAQSLARQADFYINDAFASSHRRHASIAGLPLFMPSALGFSFEKELKTLEKVISKPERPLVLILGGKKEGKLKNLDKLLSFADKILVGGGLASSPRLKLISSRKLLVSELVKNKKDISDDSINLFKSEIGKAKTIIWVGPLGEFEEEKNQEGTKEIAEAVALSKAFSIAGGGDTQAALTKFKVDEKIDYISSGGGALLYFLRNKTLPALEILKKQ